MAKNIASIFRVNWNQVASFKVQNSFSLYDRGLVLAGSILDGDVFIGDFISFEHEGVRYQKSIADIGIIDKLPEKEAQVGIYPVLDSKKESEEIKEIKETEPVIETIQEEAPKEVLPAPVPEKTERKDKLNTQEREILAIAQQIANHETVVAQQQEYFFLP